MQATRRADQTRACSSCATPRGHTRKGWAFTIREGIAVSATCPACPTDDEPIRRTTTGGRTRFRAVVDTSARGAHTRRQVTRTLDTLTAAREFVATTRAHVQADTYRAPETVTALAERWLTARAVRVRPVTLLGYRHVLAAPLRRLGHEQAATVTPADVEALTAWLGTSGGQHGGPLSVRSVRAALTALSQVFALALRDGTITRNPVAVSERPKRPASTTADAAHWSPGQLLTFKARADTDDLAALWRCTLSGLTRADVMGLRWVDVDLDSGTVTVAQGRVVAGGVQTIGLPKSEQRKRTISVEAIHPGTVGLLRSLSAAQAGDRLKAGASWQDTGLVAVDGHGAPLHPDTYSDRFTRLSSEAGVPRIRLHNVRHSLAAWMNALGILPSDAAAILGHTTAVYLAKYLPEAGATGIAAATARLGAAVRAAS